MNPQPSPNPKRLLDADSLLAALFAPDARPTVRWLRYQTKRKTIPFFRIGRLVRFDPVQVRAALEQKCLVTSRAQRAEVR